MTAYPAHARTDGAGCTIRDDSIPSINDMRVDTKHPERIRKRKTKAINWQRGVLSALIGEEVWDILVRHVHRELGPSVVSKECLYARSGHTKHIIISGKLFSLKKGLLYEGKMPDLEGSD